MAGSGMVLLLVGVRPGLPVLSMLHGPVQQIRQAIFDAWKKKVSGDVCSRAAFRQWSAPSSFRVSEGATQALTVFGQERRRFFEEFWLEGLWSGFLLEFVHREIVSCYLVTFCCDL